MADDEPAAAMAELAQAIARDILALPELAGSDWDTFALAAEVTDDYIAMTAYRYTASGPPVSTEEPEDDDLYGELRDATRGVGGQAWDVVLVRIRREPADLALTFLSGSDAARWRVTPENLEHLPESLRPRPEDFDAS